MGDLQRAQLARLLQRQAEAVRAAEFSAQTLCGRVPAQLRAVLSKAKRKVLRCGRRAGKTTAVAIKLLLAALEEGPAAPVLYVTLTRENAREIIWEILCKYNDEYKLGGEVNQSRLTITMPNGVQIQLRGAHTEKEIAKYRGKKFRLVIVDEAQSFPDRILEPLIKDVIGPTLLDYQGELWLVGTRPPVRRGYFWRCFAGDLAAQREQHSWTVVDNMELPARVAGASLDALLEDIRKENGWTEKDPTYCREYLDEDVEDLEALLFQWSALKNEFGALPEGGGWSYVFGIDVGSVDSDAIAVWGWQRNVRKLYLVDEHVEADRDVTDLADAIKRLQPIYSPISMVIDEGGGGKKTANELRRRHGLPLKAAEKTQKGAYIRMFNADLRKSVLQISKARTPRFVEDCGLVRKDPAALVRGLLQELSANQGGYHSDILDGALYGWREAYHFLENEVEEGPPPPPNQEHLERILAEQQRAEALSPLEREYFDEG
jgi:hypothetical protein